MLDLAVRAGLGTLLCLTFKRVASLPPAFGL